MCTHYAWQKSWPVSQECLFQTEIIFKKKKKKKTDRQTDRQRKWGGKKDGRKEERKEEDFLIIKRGF